VGDNFQVSLVNFGTFQVYLVHWHDPDTGSQSWEAARVVSTTGAGPSQRWVVEWVVAVPGGEFVSLSNPPTTSPGVSLLEINVLATPGALGPPPAAAVAAADPQEEGEGEEMEVDGGARPPSGPWRGPNLTMVKGQITLPEEKYGSELFGSSLVFYFFFLGRHRVQLPTVVRHRVGDKGGAEHAFVVAAVYHSRQRRNELWAYRCQLNGDLKLVVCSAIY
jgi:hypothetical protein